MLQGELAWAEDRAEQALKTGKYWSARYAPQEEPWIQYREAIATSLDDADAWSDVRDGFRAVRVLELQASKRRKGAKSQVAITDWGRKQLDFGLVRIRGAIAVLGPLAQDHPRERLRKNRNRPEVEASPAEDGDEAPDTEID